MNTSTADFASSSPLHSSSSLNFYYVSKYIDNPQNIALLLAVTSLVSILFYPSRKLPNASVFGYRSFFEPTRLLQSRFIMGANDIIHDAYETMKNKPYVLRRFDVNFLVLPMKYLEDLAPKWTSMDFLLHSNLHLDVPKLIPELYKFVDKAKEELAFGWHLDLPHTDDWTEVSIEHHLRKLVARMTAKVFMGNPTCRNPEWLEISIEFSVDLFTTAFTVKMFPTWMSWLVAGGLSANSPDNTTSSNRREPRAKKPKRKILLNWMLDHGTPSEVEVKEMGARQCVLTLASIHTTASNVSNMLYDLCAHPVWFPVLRQEIFEVAKLLNLLAQTLTLVQRNGAREWDKFDSFFVESQRHSPVLLLNPQRLAYGDITLKDGTFVPAGSRLAFANFEHSMDPNVFENPREFAPMRSYRKRMSSPDQKDQHKAGMTHPNNLAFGYGNQACAGRQFAVAEIKLIMARLLYEFDFKFPAGKTRPRTQHVNENCFTDQSMTLMMKKRET
ncbi:Cytochrome P450 [Penicillium occitanis (nom. inval.)]|nr:hypothetical protein PENOC_085500 [Penicillium occitanis (nom. inval.)]PCG95457.1 Cytochrome P450 [Penicillium occitanis (nom. inval.)]